MSLDPMANLLDMLPNLLGMLPPEVAISAKMMGEVIPGLAQEVMAGTLSPEEAAKRLGVAVVPMFHTLKEASGAH